METQKVKKPIKTRKPTKEDIISLVSNTESVNLKKEDTKTQSEYNKLSINSMLDHQFNLEQTYCNDCQVRGKIASNKFTYCLRACPVGEQFRKIGVAYEGKKG